MTVKSLNIVCCDGCEALLAHQVDAMTLQPLQLDVQITYSRRWVHLRHVGCDATTRWRIPDGIVAAPPQQLIDIGSSPC